MNCFGFDDSVDVQGTTQTFCILVEIERIEVKGLLWAGSETVRRHPQTERQHQLWMKLGISEERLSPDRQYSYAASLAIDLSRIVPMFAGNEMHSFGAV